MGLSKENVNYDQDLRLRVGLDVTSNFETDPNFTESNPTANASSENLGATRDEPNNSPDDSDTTADAVAGDLRDLSSSQPGAQSGRVRSHRKTDKAA